jgi:hypothetical protein
MILESENKLTVPKNNHFYYRNNLNVIRYFDKDFFYGIDEFKIQLFELICLEEKDYLDYDIFMAEEDYGEVINDTLYNHKEM